MDVSDDEAVPQWYAGPPPSDNIKARWQILLQVMSSDDVILPKDLKWSQVALGGPPPDSPLETRVQVPTSRAVLEGLLGELNLTEYTPLAHLLAGVELNSDNGAALVSAEPA